MNETATRFYCVRTPPEYVIGQQHNNPFFLPSPFRSSVFFEGGEEGSGPSVRLSVRLSERGGVVALGLWHCSPLLSVRMLVPSLVPGAPDRRAKGLKCNLFVRSYRGQVVELQRADGGGFS